MLNIFILREICQRRHCPPSVTLALLLFLVGPDWVGNLSWDNLEPYEPFRWVNTEPSVQFRKANTDPSVQFRKANTDPSMQFTWDHTEFLSCKMLGKNLHESVRPLSHLQTSPGKSSCQDAFGKSLCNALPYCHPSELPSQNLAILYKYVGTKLW